MGKLRQIVREMGVPAKHLISGRIPMYFTGVTV